VLGAESLDELGVLGFSAGLVEDAKVGLTLVESLSSLTETTGETVVNHGDLEDLLESILYTNYHCVSIARSSKRGREDVD